MSNSHIEVVPVDRQVEQAASATAQVILELIDTPRHRGGRALIRKEAGGSGTIKVHREKNGRLHIRAPRDISVSIRLSPTRSGLLKTSENKNALVAFLEKDVLLLSVVGVAFR
jgi:hypothetical protein